MGADTALDAVRRDIDTAVSAAQSPGREQAGEVVDDLQLRQLLEQVLLRTPTTEPSTAVPAVMGALELASAAGPAVDLQAPPQQPAGRGKRQKKAPLPEGVLAKAGPVMGAAIGVIAAAAMGEAGWNLATFVHQLLHLPAVLAGVFPVIAETTALSFAVQDLLDRRQGVTSMALRVATYITLGISAVVNGFVGVAMYGLGGLLEVLAPLALGVVIHLHGDRATRAHQSRARLSPTWRQQQLRAAQLDSVVEVLPLLTGEDQDGRATVALLRRRLLSATLEPGEALIAAGWHERAEHHLTGSQLRRLETVAATVWGLNPPPAPTPAIAAAPAPALTAAPTPAPITAPGAPRPGGGSRSAAAGTRPDKSGRRADDAKLAALVAQARRTRPNAGEGSVRTLLTKEDLSADSRRIRAALKAAKAADQANPDQGDQVDPQGVDSVFEIGSQDADLAGEGGDRW